MFIITRLRGDVRITTLRVYASPCTTYRVVVMLYTCQSWYLLRVCGGVYLEYPYARTTHSSKNTLNRTLWVGCQTVIIYFRPRINTHTCTPGRRVSVRKKTERVLFGRPTHTGRFRGGFTHAYKTRYNVYLVYSNTVCRSERGPVVGRASGADGGGGQLGCRCRISFDPHGLATVNRRHATRVWRRLVTGTARRGQTRTCFDACKLRADSDGRRDRRA